MPVSHNIRRSLNLENLSLHDRSWDETRDNVTLENEVFAPTEDVYPTSAIIAASTGRNDKTSTASGSVSEHMQIRDVTKANPSSNSERKSHAPAPHFTSLAKNPSTRTSDGNFTHGQNTFNSTDSSGYSSSTVEILDQSFKKCLSDTSRSKYQTKPSSPVAHKETTEFIATGEDCPEESASEFSFRLNLSSCKFSGKNGQGVKQNVLENQQFTNSINFKPTFTATSCAPGLPRATAPTPAPRTRYKSSRTTSATESTEPEPLRDPWLHKSQVPQSVKGEAADFCTDFMTNPPLKKLPNHKGKNGCLVQRSKSERIFSSGEKFPDFFSNCYGTEAINNFPAFQPSTAAGEEFLCFILQQKFNDF